MELATAKARRDKVFEQMQDNSVALLSAAPLLHRNSDTEFPYRQQSHFYYLTGFEESSAIAVLMKKNGQPIFILFCEEKDPAIERWTGPRVGLALAKEQYGADESYPISDASEKISYLLQGLSRVYYLLNESTIFDRKIFTWIKEGRKKVRSGISVPFQFVDLRVILDELRLIKSSEEIALIEKACHISTQGHLKVMQQCQPGMYEYELEAILLQEFYSQGSRYPAYPSIVGAGKNSCILHYTRNQSTIENGDVVLVDAGAEMDYYAADITRTFPVKKTFSSAQQALYELVLSAQTAAIEKVKPGLVWSELQQTILEVLVAGLVDLKILNGDVQSLIQEKAYYPFYMHNSGHWLGLDVHDVGEYKIQGQSRALQKGMLFTVEPGLYISKNSEVDEKWHDIGIRIEDDILVTESGKKVLTENLPKSVNEIEKLRS